MSQEFEQKLTEQREEFKGIWSRRRRKPQSSSNRKTKKLNIFRSHFKKHKKLFR